MTTALLLVHPGTDVEMRAASLSLLERNVLWAKDAGATRVVVTGSSSQSDKGNPDVDYLDTEDLQLDDGDDYLVISASAVYDRKIGKALANATVAPGAALGIRSVVSAQSAPKPIIAFRISRERAQQVNWQRACASLAGAHSEISKHGEVDYVDLPGQLVYQPVPNQASISAAEDALFNACRKPSDGLVSRNFNRHLSIFISRRIVDTAVSPNAITILCLLFAILGGGLTLHGSYWAIVFGAFFFELNSIVDGVDGELARVRWQFSPFGEFFDTAVDNLSNYLYFGALTFVAFQSGEDIKAWAGAIGLSAWALYLVFLYGKLAFLGRGDSQQVTMTVDEVKTGTLHAVVNALRLIFRRDLFVTLAFVLAVLNQGTTMLFFVLIGGTVTMTTAAVDLITRGARRLRSEPSAETAP